MVFYFAKRAMHFFTRSVGVLKLTQNMDIGGVLAGCVWVLKPLKKEFGVVKAINNPTTKRLTAQNVHWTCKSAINIGIQWK